MPIILDLRRTRINHTLKSFYHPLILQMLWVVFLVSAPSGAAQPHPSMEDQTGTLAGRVVDRNTGEPLALVQVYIESLMKGDVTTHDGTFRISNIPPGAYRIRCRLIGYQATHTDTVHIIPGETTILEIEMVEAPYRAREIQVTASRHAALEQSVPQFVSILSRQEMQARNAGQTPELLREEAGVVVQKTNQGGGSPILRGLRANKVLLLIDGIRLNNATYRGGNVQYANTISPASLSQVEIVRGPVSALYGSDALGGAIHFMTRNPDLSGNPGWRWQGQAATRFSSADQTASFAVGTEMASPRLGIIVDASVHRYGDVKRGDAGGGALMHRLQNDSRTSRKLQKTQSPNGYDSFELAAKALWRPLARHRFTIAYQRHRQRKVPRYDVIETGNHSLWQYDPQERDLFYIRYEHKGPTALFTSAQATFSINRQFERRVKQKTGSTTQTRDQFETLTYGAQVQFNRVLLRRHYLVYGAEYYVDHVATASSALDLSSGTVAPRATLYPNGSRYHNFGAFAQAELMLTSSWQLNLSARYSAFRLLSNFTDDVLLPELTSVEISPAALTAGAGTAIALSEQVRLVANVAQGFRAPNLDDVAKLGPGKGDNIYEVPGPNLSPEQMLGLDAGLKLASERTRAHIVFYYNRIRDILLRRPGTYAGRPYVIDEGDTLAVFMKKNAGRAYTTGFEGGFQASLPGSFGVTIFGAAGYVYAQNTTLHEPLSGIPPLHGLAGVRWRKRAVEFELRGRFAAAQTRLSSEDKLDLRIPEGGTPGWWTLTFRAGWQLRDKVSVRFAIENLLDRNYREHLSGMNAPGRNFVLAGEVDF